MGSNPALRMVPMTPEEFSATLERIAQDYAREKARAGNWPAGEALARAREETASLLPAGLHTPNEHLCTLRDVVTNAAVGDLWYGLRDDGAGPYLWVWDIWIHPDHRRRGYATAALAALAGRAREMGITTISLHVFGHNLAARALYEKLGFQITNLHLSQHLD